MHRIVFLFLISVFGFSGPVFAQDRQPLLENPAFQYEGERIPRAQDLSFFYNPRYDQVVRRAFVTWPNEFFDFYHLRAYYRRTRQYDPIADDVIERLSAYALQAEDTDTLEEKLEVTGRFQNLVLEHLANLDVVLFALSYARDDIDYGDPKFYAWVRDGILNDIMSKSDGKTIDDPYELISMGEETAILNALKVKPVYTELLSDGQDFFHIHLVEDLKSGEQSELYTNVSIPMRHIKLQVNLQKRYTPQPIDIRRQ